MRNILILTYWSYSDALIQTYSLPYIRIIKNKLPPGSSVFLLTLEKDPRFLSGKLYKDTKNKLKLSGIDWIPVLYRPFGIRSFYKWFVVGSRLWWLIFKRRISFIHCWCTPAGAIGFVLSVITNRTLVLDSFEPHAEAMVENGTWKKNSLAFRLLFWLEKMQTRRAGYIIAVTEAMRYYVREKFNLKMKNYFVKPACVDLELFSLNKIKNITLLKSNGLENKIVCVYAGKIGGIYLDQEIFDFLAVAAKHWRDNFRALLLTNANDEEIKMYCVRAKLNPDVLVIKFVPHHEIPSYIGLADFALTPVKAVPSKRYCTPIKDGEYWALGLPVVIPANISDDSEIIESNYIGAVLQELNDDAYSEAVKKISVLLNDPTLKVRIRSIAEKYRNFKIAEKIYKTIYHG